MGHEFTVDSHFLREQRSPHRPQMDRLAMMIKTNSINRLFEIQTVTFGEQLNDKMKCNHIN